MENIIKHLDKKKIEMNWNKNPIKVNTLLSFLSIPMTKSTDHLGSDNGWTLFFNKEHQIYIHGGVVNRENYLDTIKYKSRLENPYNNLVSPFHIFGLLSTEGKKFFVDYYRDDIDKAVSKQKEKVEHLESLISKEKALASKMQDEFENLIAI